MFGKNGWDNWIPRPRKHLNDHTFYENPRLKKINFWISIEMKE